MIRVGKNDISVTLSHARACARDATPQAWRGVAATPGRGRARDVGAATRLRAALSEIFCAELDRAGAIRRKR